MLAQTGQRKFWQIETGNFVRKTENFVQTGHTRRRAEQCAAALQANSLGTCCERQKRDRVMKPVLYKMTSICLFHNVAYVLVRMK